MSSKEATSAALSSDLPRNASVLDSDSGPANRLSASATTTTLDPPGGPACSPYGAALKASSWFARPKVATAAAIRLPSRSLYLPMPKRRRVQLRSLLRHPSQTGSLSIRLHLTRRMRPLMGTGGMERGSAQLRDGRKCVIEISLGLQVSQAPIGALSVDDAAAWLVP